MKAQTLSQAVALALFVSACHLPGTCKVGNEVADCPSNAYCYTGKDPKVGDNGVCVYVALPAIAGPVISSFSPTEAALGATLTILGENFSADPSENSVTLNGVPAAILFASENELRIEVPKNMRCAGLVQVTVGNQIATSSTDFTYMPTATVSTFAGSGDRGIGNGGFADGPGHLARFHSPIDIAIDVEGNLYVADVINNRIRKVTMEKEVSTFASDFNTPWGLTIDAENNLYVTDAHNHRIRRVAPDGRALTFAGEGTAGFRDAPAPGTDARFNEPDGITRDAEGNLYVADTKNNRIRKVAPDGEVSTLAGSGQACFADAKGTAACFNSPNGIAIDNRTNTLYVADTENNRIRKVTMEGEVSTIAGNGVRGFLDGMSMDAQFNFPHGIAIDDRNGNLYVADAHNNRIRMVTPKGAVSTLTGSGTAGHSEGAKSTARFDNPCGIAIDAEGNLYVADTYNHRIRKIMLE